MKINADIFFRHFRFSFLLFLTTTKKINQSIKKIYKKNSVTQKTKFAILKKLLKKTVTHDLVVSRNARTHGRNLPAYRSSQFVERYIALRFR